MNILDDTPFILLILHIYINTARRFGFYYIYYTFYYTGLLLSLLFSDDTTQDAHGFTLDVVQS